VCFDFLYNFCLKRFSFSQEFSEIWSKMYIGLHVNYWLFLLEFKETSIFLTDFGNFMKTLSVDAEFALWTDGRTDEVNSRISQFCKRD